jgi:prepilin-type N-terminal cleavage/methylation domain-containing protein
MTTRGYSLVEVMVAAAIVAVGLTAAAVLIGTLMQQEELNAATLRAANLQEQAVKLYRLDLSPTDIVDLLPENSARIALGTVPPEGVYGFSFSRDAETVLTSADGNIIVDVSSCTMVFSNPGGEGGTITNRVSIVRPSIRVEYNQN